MALFKKRETLVQNITYMAIMAAINVIFVLLTTFIPFLLFLLILLLPLTSVVVTIFCKKRYFPIYAFATIGVCFISTIWNIGDTIFYVIPSIISGFIFGLLIEKKIHPIYSILLATIIQCGLTYTAIPLANLFFSPDVITFFANAFNITNYIDYVQHIFIFFISLVQETFAFIIIKSELPKLGIEINEESYNIIVLLLIKFLMIVLIVLFYFFLPQLTFIPLFVLIYIASFLLINLILQKKTIIYILLGITLLVSLLLFAIFYQYIKDPLGLILIGIYPLFIGIIVLINNFFIKRT